MHRFIGKLIRIHPKIHATAVRAYMPVERHVGRIRRARLLTDHQQTVRAKLAPRTRGRRGAGPKVLFISTRGYNFHQLVDGVIAHGLQLRGAQVEFFTCGGGLSLCDLGFEFTGLTPTHCEYCTDCSLKTIKSFGHAKPHTLRGLISAEEVERWAARAPELVDTAADFVHRGVPVGELVDLSLRYVLLRASVPDTEVTRSYRARMVVSACMLVDAFERLLDKSRPDRLFIFNGLGFPEKVARFVAERRGIPYTTYECGLRPATLLAAHDSVASWLEMSEKQWSRFASLPLTEEQDRVLDEYIASRCAGAGGIEVYWPEMESDQGEIRRQLQIPPGVRIVTLFTNMICDLAVLDRDRAFPSMVEWIRTTIEYFGKHRPDDILCLRIHPVEARYWLPSTERVVDELERIELPPNLRVIGPDQVLSSYQLMRMSEVGLVYSTTVGMEMALMGRDVIVAAVSHYDRKGFTYSPDTREEYLQMLDSAIPRRGLSPEQLALARRYAYTFWYRETVDFPFVTIPAPAQPELYIEDPSLLERGRHSEFDVLCDAILTGKDVLDYRWAAETSPGNAPLQPLALAAR